MATGVSGSRPAGPSPTQRTQPESRTLTATCFDAETGQVLVDHAAATFEVIAPPTPPTTEPPTPPTPPTTVPETPQAPPAAPVPAEPSFTG
jgi:hypothetical protein